VRRLANRIAGLLWLRATLRWAAAWALVWGAAVLVLRMGWRTDRLPLTWGAAGLGMVALAAGVHAWRSRPGGASLRALVDDRSRAGGLIMAAEETDLGAWRARVPAEAAGPTLRYRGRRATLLLAAALAFLAVAFLVPEQLTEAARANRLNVGDEVAELEAKIESLEQEQLLKPVEAEELKRKLDEVARESSGTDPARTWEALDHLAETLAAKADEAAEEAIAEAEQLDAVEARAETADQQFDASGEPVDGAALAESLRELKHEVEQAMAESEAFEKLLDAETAKQLKDLSELSPEALEKLAKLDPETAEKLQQLAQQMQEMDADALAHVAKGGAVTVFEGRPKMTLEQLQKQAGKLAAPHAVRLTTGKVFEEDPTVVLTVELSKFGAGERILAMKETQTLAVYKLDAGATVDLAKLGEPDEEYVLTVSPAGDVQRYVYEPNESQACQAAAQNPQQQRVFRITSQAARLGQQQLQQMVQRMVEQGLIDPAKLAQAQSAAEGGGRPGRGGISRGRGDAPMTWKDPSNEEGAEFEEQALPPGAMRSMKDAELVGVSVGAPDEAEGESASAGGALSGAEAAGGSAHRQTTLPQHRRAVERYFERQ